MTARGERSAASSLRGAVRAAIPACLIAVILLVTIAAATVGCADRADPGAVTTLKGPPPETTSPGGTTPTTSDDTTDTTPNTTGATAGLGTTASGTTNGTSTGGTSATAGADGVSGDLEALGRLAISQYQEQDLTGAARTYQAMLALDAADPLIHNNYANVLRDLGRPADAEKEYERALALDATLVSTYLNLATLHLREQDQAKALSVLDRGIAGTTGADRLRLQDLKNQIAG